MKIRNKVHVVYFTCSKHFTYLAISLESLVKLRSKFLGNVYLYVDKEDFLTEEQIGSLRKIRSDLTIRRCSKLSWAGEQTILTELQAFKEINEEIPPESYIAKVDSDVLFISGDIFSRVLKTNDFLVGHREDYWAPFFHTQGGCYFLKSSFIPNLSDFKRNVFSEVLEKINNETAKSKNRFINACPEDAAIYSIVKSKTDRVSFLEFYYSSVFHFGTNKDKMPGFYRSKMFAYRAKYNILKILPAPLRSMFKNMAKPHNEPITQ